MPYLMSENTQIYYETSGSGLPVILIAGMSLETEVWSRIVHQLQDSTRTICMDLRGSGKSDAPRGPYTTQQLAHDVIELMNHLRLERSVLVGHSLGGYVAQEAAYMRPDLVQNLILISTSAVGRSHLLEATDRAAQTLANTGGSLTELTQKTVEIGFGSIAKNHYSDAIQEFVAMRLERPPKGRGYVGQRSAAEKFDMRKKLDQITCPCLVMHGDEDEMIGLKNGELLASSLPQATFVHFPGVGHFPQIEVPGLVARNIRDFLGK